MKTAEDIKLCREISARLRELGIPNETMDKIDAWTDRQEQRITPKKSKGR